MCRCFPEVATRTDNLIARLRAPKCGRFLMVFRLRHLGCEGGTSAAESLVQVFTVG